jgi:cytochrome P450
MTQSGHLGTSIPGSKVASAEADSSAGTAPDRPINGDQLNMTQPGWSMRLTTDPEFGKDPRPYFALMRSGPPARDELKIPGRRPTVWVSRAKDVEATLRSPQLFSSKFEGLGNDRPLIPVQIDPPDHKKWRVLLDPYFAPRQLGKHEQTAEALVNQLIDKFIERGSCEFTSEFAIPLPCTVFLQLMGLPLEKLEYFLWLKDGTLHGHGETDPVKRSEASRDAGLECYAYFNEALDRIAVDRTAGLLLDLFETEVDGVRLTRDEIVDICYLFIIAGLDTVTDSLCCFWSFLAEHPDHRQRIAEDPDVIPSALEELLRWESPVTAVGRVATVDTDIGGCPVHQGDSITVLVGAANTDPTAFEEADQVDFDRPINRHRAFGQGIHRCLGSHLARLELRVALSQWHRRIPEYRIRQGADLVWTPMMRSVHEMPLEWEKELL